MAKFAVLRTHGGLGNQLFQVLYARLYSLRNGLILSEIHDSNYAHQFKRSECLLRSSAPNFGQRLISMMRIPKIVKRIANINDEKVQIGRTVYLDGYFQDVDCYKRFDRTSIKSELCRLALNLGVSKVNNGSSLMHLRLGDFFSDEESEVRHVLERLKNAAPNTKLISNNNGLFARQEIACELNKKSLTVLDTSAMTGEEVLRIMSKHKYVYSNNSTLAFWATVLSEGILDTQDPILKECHKYFCECS